MFKVNTTLVIASLLIWTIAVPVSAMEAAGVRSSLESTQVDPHSGSAGMGYGIAVPQGRGGIQPNIGLSYNSNSKNGIVGVGWNFELGSVHRSTKDGVPAYDNQVDTFLLIQNGSTQEIIYDTTKGYYRPVQEGSFLKIELTGDVWTVVDKNGITYTFGGTSSEREYIPTDSTKILKWGLSRVEDVHGNYMTVSYMRDGDKLYPEYVDYTGHVGQAISPYAQVEFVYENRDDPQCTYNNGIKFSINKRLSDIKTYVGSTLQRRYNFEYTQSSVTDRSLLTKVTQYGADNTSSLPATLFAYEDNDTVAQKYESLLAIDSTAPATGDNIWNVRYDPNYDRGHEVYGACPPTHMCYGVQWGSTLTAASGSLPGGGSYTTTGTGNISLTAGQDTAIHLWTFLYSDTAQTVSVPYSGDYIGGLVGVYLNGDYTTNHTTSWPLKQGYNLVEITMYHQHISISFNLNKSIASSVTRMNSERTAQNTSIVGDFNGDGLTDLLSTENDDIHVSLSTGSNFVPAAEWLGSDYALNRKIVVGDFNADGRADIAAIDEDDGDWYIAHSDGTQFVDQGLKKDNWAANEEMSAGDMNGDGYTDLLTFYKTGGNWTTRVAINDKSGVFTEDSMYSYTVGNDDYTPVSGNFNGDGLLDFGTFDRTNGDWVIKLNTGSTTDPFNTLPTINDFGSNFNMVVADFNADGLTDIGYYDYQSGGVFYRLSNGGGFGDSRLVDDVNFTFLDNGTQVQASDFNGDSMADWMAYDETGNIEIAMSNLQVPDLLVEAQNGVGGTTTIAYQPSSTFNNTYMPFTVPVVDTVTVSNGLGDSYATSYFYSKGLWDATDREFRGFGMVRISDPEGNYQETDYLQTEPYVGQVEEQRSYDATDQLFSKTEFTWDKKVICPTSPIDFPYLKRKDNYVYDGDSTARRTAEEFFYDEATQLGNLTKAVQYGEVNLNDGTDIGSDTRTVETAYVNNETDRIIGLPRLVTVKDNAGSEVRKTWFYYDGAASNNATPVKGLLTKKEDWAGDGPGDTNPETEYTYDAYGNLLTTTDPRDNVTSIAYDTGYQVFPLTTTNALSHAVTNEYYGVNGVSQDSGDGYSGLWGQLKSTTDPNNQKGSRVYDTFGRLTKTISPLDTLTHPTTETEYTFLTNYSKIVQYARVVHGEADTAASFSFYDGLGRLSHQKTRSEAVGQYTVAGHTEYNSRGLPTKKYAGYFSTKSIDDAEPIEPGRLHTTITYDAMGRVIQTTNPDNTYSTIAYDDWTTVTTNENGHKQESDFDAYGRLIEKREYTGADGRSSHYSSASYALYATTQYEYDSEGNLIKTIDDDLNETVITYDELGRKIQMNDPDMGVWSYEYDLSGNLTKQTDAKAQEITFTYDALNRLVNKADGASLNVTYTYDDTTVSNSKGRLTDASYSGENTEFKYDVLGREIQSVKKIGVEFFNVERGYDALSRLDHVEYPDAAEVYYTYNEAGQIIGIADTKMAASDWEENYLPDPTFQYDFNDNSSTSNQLTDSGNVALHGAIFSYEGQTPKALLHLDGADASTTIEEESEQHTFTAYNGAQLDTAAAKFGTASLLLDGSNDYIQAADSEYWDIGKDTTSDWTLDAWIKLDNPSGEGVIAAQYQGGGSTVNSNAWYFRSTWGGVLQFLMLDDNSQAVLNFSGGVISDSDWHHVALVKTGDDWGLYLDGQQVASAMDVATTFDFTAPLTIGQRGDGIQHFDGHIDEVRIAKYNVFNAIPEAQNTSFFSTPLEEGAMTMEGAPLLLLEGDGFDSATTTVDSMNRHTPTLVNGASLNAGTKKFGESSLRFDGSNDYAWMSDHADWDILASATDSWTIDGWIKLDNPSGEGVIVAQYQGGGSTVNSNCWYFRSTWGGVLQFLAFNNNSQVEINFSGGVISDSDWHHVALVKMGDTWALYLDGQQVGYQTGITYTDTFNGLLYAGQRGDGIQYFDGHIDELRVSRTNTFMAMPNAAKTDTISTPSQTAFGSGEDDSFLVFYDGADGATTVEATDSAFTLNMYNGAQLDTAAAKFGASSLLLDGTNDYMTALDHDYWDIAKDTTGDWTLDAWIKLDNPAGEGVIAGQYQGGGPTVNSNCWYFRSTWGGVLQFLAFDNNSQVTLNFSGGVIADSNWHHVALAKVGDDWGLFLDGQQVANATDVTTTFNYNAALSIGQRGDGIQYLDGHIDEMRIAPRNIFGVAPNANNTSTFTVPSSQFVPALTSSKLATTGVVAGAFELDGASEFIDIKDAQSFIAHNATGSFAGWVYVPMLAEGQRTIVSFGDTDDDTYFQIYLDDDNKLLAEALSNGSSLFKRTTDTALAGGVWHHVAVVQDGTAPVIYVDGVVAASTELAGTPVNSAWLSSLSGLDNGRIGALNYDKLGEKYFYDGSLDNWRYYGSVALNAVQVAVLYNSGNGIEDLNPSTGEGSSSGGTPTNIYVADVDYNVHGQIVRIEYGNGAVTSYTYDSQTLRLTRILTKDDVDATIQDLNYTYDSIGNVLSIIDNTGTDDQTFTYDALNRLVSATGSYGAKTYAYDEIGNITSKDGKTYTYGAGGAGPHAVTSLSDGTTFTYDDNGNMATKQIGTTITYYTWDVENRLVKVEKDEGSGLTTLADYAYDGDGGRVSKTVGSKTTKFVGGMYDEDSTGRETKYVFLGNQRVAQITKKGTTTHELFYHTNHLGSTHVLTDANADVKEVIEYMPYGATAVHNKYGTAEEVAWHYFTDHYHDADVDQNLVYMQARFFDSSLGRFLTPDTIVQDPEGNSQTFNRYSYTANNPVNFIDPSGHIFGFIFAAVKILAAYAIEHAAAIAIGAAIGGIGAAATGGNIWQGILTGAIGGGIFGGIGGLGLDGFAQLGAHAAGGAVSGGISAAITGGDIIQGVLIGGLSAGVTQGLGQQFSFLSAQAESFKQFAGAFVGRAVIGAVIGGAVATATGGEFGDGAATGAITSGIAFIANDALHGKGYLRNKIGGFLKSSAPGSRAMAVSLNVSSNADPAQIKAQEQSVGWWKRVEAFFVSAVDTLFSGLTGSPMGPIQATETAVTLGTQIPKINQGMQNKYDSYGDALGEFGPENPYYYNSGIQTRDGRSHQERINSRR